MEISSAAVQPTRNGGQKQSGDSSEAIQRLEEQKKNIQQQIKQLEQSRQGEDAIKAAKESLSKQLREIDRQIQVLKQQETAQPAQEDAEARPPRFDEYVKNDQEASGAGIYSVEEDENGNPLIVFDGPEKPPRESPGESPASAKRSPEEEGPEITKCTVNTDRVDAEIKALTERRQSVREQLKQAQTPEEKAELEQQLSNLEAELRAKDNDAYRKQNATYTYA